LPGISSTNCAKEGRRSDGQFVRRGGEGRERGRGGTNSAGSESGEKSDEEVVYEKKEGGMEI